MKVFSVENKQKMPLHGSMPISTARGKKGGNIKQGGGLVTGVRETPSKKKASELQIQSSTWAEDRNTRDKGKSRKMY